MKTAGLMAGLLAAVLMVGCQSAYQKAYYSVWETLGKEKRHLLKANVEKAKDEQSEASEEFKDVLTRIKDLYGYEGGELENVYNRLKMDYDLCEHRAKSIGERVEKVETIATDLFAEWEAEIETIGNPKFRANSRASLENAKKRYAGLHKAMKAAQNGMAPVLSRLNDYVLYFKHNLNARAVGALKSEMDDIEADVDSLVKDIRASIGAADEFLKTIE